MSPSSMLQSTSSESVAHVPSFDVAPEGEHRPRWVSFEGSGRVSRRGFLGVAAVGGMALGLSALSWVPVTRRAAATVGTEYTNCSVFAYDGIICTPQIYATGYCGSDKWFKNGCFRAPDGFTDCYRPVAACNGRNAWRWRHSDGAVYRCADGQVKWGGTGNWLFKICNARL